MTVTEAESDHPNVELVCTALEKLASKELRVVYTFMDVFWARAAVSGLPESNGIAALPQVLSFLLRLHPAPGSYPNVSSDANHRAVDLNEIKAAIKWVGYNSARSLERFRDNVSNSGLPAEECLRRLFLRYIANKTVFPY